MMNLSSKTKTSLENKNQPGLVLVPRAKLPVLKLDNGTAVDSQSSVKTGASVSPQKGDGVKKVKHGLPNGNGGSASVDRAESQDNNSPIEKDDGALGPMSPESIEGT
ncbi:hypothetical protein EYC84_009083 [Monilinia fructicola]|uniref:Uncharacterized protein n=1 Tax=Monilinia fructicola TaxID=38448 RepID=A0A5M9JAA5_MONFR|nr:hypothetical protein EYC84_009083 [Monilinia fructicola]